MPQHASSVALFTPRAPNPRPQLTLVPPTKAPWVAAPTLFDLAPYVTVDTQAKSGPRTCSPTAATP